MKEVLFAILFLVIFIIFGILFYTNSEILRRLDEIEKRTSSCENSMLMSAKTNEVQFKIMNEILEQIKKIQRRNFVLN